MALTLTEMNEYLGKEGVIEHWSGDLSIDIDVKVTDVKISWGKTRYEVTPISGSGNVWVEDGTIKFKNSRSK